MKRAVKCIVTGGAGFIGSHLCDRLIAEKFEVFCIDNLLTGSEKNINHLLKNRLFHYIFHDAVIPLNDSVIEEIKGTSYIFHLASPASPPYYRKYAIQTLMVNSVGTYNMLNLAKKFKARFLLASTSEVYGDPKQHPQKENYFGYVNPVGIRACYDEAKRFSEAITMEYHRKYNIDTRIVRIFNTYGPRMKADDGRVISNFITQAISKNNLTVYGDGNQTRSFCYITDMVEGIVGLMKKDNIDGEIVNLGNPDEKKIIDIARLVLKLTDSPSKIIKMDKRLGDDPERRKPDISKAKKIFGWIPKVDLNKGIVSTAKYFSQL